MHINLVHLPKVERAVSSVPKPIPLVLDAVLLAHPDARVPQPLRLCPPHIRDRLLQRDPDEVGRQRSEQIELVRGDEHRHFPRALGRLGGRVALLQRQQHVVEVLGRLGQARLLAHGRRVHQEDDPAQGVRFGELRRHEVPQLAVARRVDQQELPRPRTRWVALGAVLRGCGGAGFG